MSHVCSSVCPKLSKTCQIVHTKITILTQKQIQGPPLPLGPFFSLSFFWKFWIITRIIDNKIGLLSDWCYYRLLYWVWPNCRFFQLGECQRWATNAFPSDESDFQLCEQNGQIVSKTTIIIMSRTCKNKLNDINYNCCRRVAKKQKPFQDCFCRNVLNQFFAFIEQT